MLKTAWRSYCSREDLFDCFCVSPNFQFKLWMKNCHSTAAFCPETWRSRLMFYRQQQKSFKGFINPQSQLGSLLIMWMNQKIHKSRWLEKAIDAKKMLIFIFSDTHSKESWPKYISEVKSKKRRRRQRRKDISPSQTWAFTKNSSRFCSQLCWTTWAAYRIPKALNWFFLSMIRISRFALPWSWSTIVSKNSHYRSLIKKKATATRRGF